MNVCGKYQGVPQKCYAIYFTFFIQQLFKAITPTQPSPFVFDQEISDCFSDRNQVKW